MSKKAAPLPDVRSALLRVLDAGQTGCLSAEVEGLDVVRVYVMLGEALAAHAVDDAAQCFRLLTLRGALTPTEADASRRRVEAGEPLSEVLFAVAPEDLVLPLLHDRFRENLFRFLGSADDATFEEMESIFVDNIQVGYDTRAIVDELEALRLRVRPAAVLLQRGLYPGSVRPTDPDAVRIVDALRAGRGASSVFDRVPREPSQTLVLLAEMLAAGVVSRDPPTVLPEQAGAPPEPAARPAPPKAEAPPARPGAPAGSTQAGDAAAKPAPPAPAPAPVAKPAPTPAATAPVPAAAAPVEDAAEPAPADEPTAGPAPRMRRNIDTPRSAMEKAFRRALAAGAGDGSSTDPFSRGGRGGDEPTEDEVEEELFADNDRSRGDGSFTTAKELLDRVELPAAGRPAMPAPSTPTRIEAPIEMQDAESAGKDALAHVVALNFAGPKLEAEEIQDRLQIVNEILEIWASAVDAAQGAGMGQTHLQLLVEGTQGAFAPLFRQVDVAANGTLPIDVVMRNLRKRPAAEHRRLLGRGVADLIERALSLASENMEEAPFEHMLERIAQLQRGLAI